MKRSLICVWRAGLAVLLVLLTVLFSGCGYRRIKPSEADLREVGTVGSHTVTYDELYHVAMTCRDALKSVYGEEIFDTAESRDAYREELLELTYDTLTSNFAVFDLASDIRYTEDDVQEYVDTYMEELVESLGGRHAYKKMLHETYMTDNVARSNYAATLLQGNLFTSYVEYLGVIESDAEKIYSIIMEGSTYIRTRHIALFKDNGKTDAENRTAIEAIRAELDAGADFDTLVKTYGEDENLTRDGYYFMKGEMQEPYEEAAFALSVGEISDVVETEDGFYLIRRYEKQKEYVLLNCYGEGAPLYDSYQQYTFLAIIDEYRESLTFVPNAFGASIDLTGLSEKPFFDGEYLLLVIGIVLLACAFVGLIVWWCVASVREDRKGRPQSAKKNHKKH